MLGKGKYSVYWHIHLLQGLQVFSCEFLARSNVRETAEKGSKAKIHESGFLFLVSLFEGKSWREDEKKHCLFILERETQKREKGEVKRPP